MHRSASALGLALVVALAGCERPPIECFYFVYDERRMTCVCPMGSVELEDGSCMLPDGGILFPPGVDAGLRTDAGTDAGPDPIDSGTDGGTDACELGTYYRDSDGDGAGDPATSMQSCAMPAGFVDNDDDCDDSCLACRPGGAEVCDELDNDCDDSTDEDVLSLYFRDADGDTFGNPAMPRQACSIPVGFVDNDDDCDDDCPVCRPGGTEVCDIEMRDENCTGGGNDGCSCADGMTRACPGGSDVGECVAGTQTCAGGAWGACTGAVAPATETCNGSDDDCDMTIDGPVAAAACPAVPRATSRACSAGECFITTCSTGYGNCDTTYANGCETRLGSLEHCAACDDSCGWACEATACDDAVTVAPGGSHTCVLREAGGVVCWGVNSSGQLGDGSGSNQTAPVSVAGLTSDVAAIDSGNGHTCAALMSGRVRCWGADDEGQLGNDGSLENRTTPDAVSTIVNATTVSAGGAHTCALLATNSVMCWGRGDSGQLGNGSFMRRTEPVGVTLSNVIAIAAGGNHTCALVTGGDVYCWGYGGQGQIGDGMLANRPLPTRVTGLPATAVSVSAGGDHSCAALSNGEAWCWGANSRGQLGDSSRMNRPTPVRVTGLSGARAVSAGGTHTCATTATTVYCWGRNTSGQLGDASTMERGAPVPVSSLMPFSDLETGNNHTCATLVTGGIVCWGNHGVAVSDSVPVAIAAPEPR